MLLFLKQKLNTDFFLKNYLLNASDFNSIKYIKLYPSKKILNYMFFLMILNCTLVI